MNKYTCTKCGWSGVVNGRQRCLVCARRRIKAWRADNPEKARAQQKRHEKKFRTERREEYKARRRKYYVPKTAKEAWARRVRWLMAGDVTRTQLIELYGKHNGTCKYCGTHVKARFVPMDPRGFDHIKPRIKGGKHTAKNMVVCCRRCNELKAGGKYE